MSELNLDSQVHVGTLDGVAFSIVVPPLSTQEVNMLSEAGVVEPEDVMEVDESACIVGAHGDPESSLDQQVSVATQRAARIVAALNSSGLREVVTVLSPQPKDIAPALTK